jgi:hypothetical protein
LPLSKIQTDILRLLAAHRDPDSYVAGGAALNRDAPRYSEQFAEAVKYPRRRRRRGMQYDKAMSGAAQVSSQNPEASVRKRLVGAWKLLSDEVLVDGKVVYPFGEHPVGRLTYDEAGRISAQIMQPGQQSSVSDFAAISRASADEVRQIAEGYLGYYGSFVIDEQNKTVIHHVEACSLPAWVGTDQRRKYEFDGPRLVLRSGPYKLVWERLPD